MGTTTMTTTETTKPKIKLTYFDIEAAGEPVRLALLLSNTPFEDERIKFHEWKELKPKTPNGQLPVMTIGDDDSKMLTQSKAMLRYIGKTYSKTLYPDEKLYEIEEMIGLLEDLERSFRPSLYLGMRPTLMGYPDGYSKTDEGKETIKRLRTQFVQDELSKYCKRFTKILEDNQQNGGKYFIMGEQPTIVDCVAIPMLRSFTKGHIDYIETTCLDEYPVIVQYIKNFCSIDVIKGRYDKGIF